MSILRSHSELDTLPGGKYRLTQYIKPIAYDHSGAWTRITNVLGNSGDPNFPIGTDELLQFRVRNRLAGQSPMLHFGKGHHSLWATLLDTNNTDGIVNGAAILFPNAWNNADFELIPAGHKIKGNVYLRSGHPQTYRLRIDESTGFDPATLMLGDVARILPPVLLPPASSPAAQIPLSWAITQQGGKWILAVTLPAGDYAGWVLDPTLTLQPDATDGKDTYATPFTPATNYGTNVNVWSGGIFSPDDEGHTFIQFDLSSIPAGSTVVSSVLTLTRTVTYGTYAYTVKAHALLRSWTEAGATWITYDGTNNWQTEGGIGALDRDATVEGSHVLTYGATDTFSIPVMTQAWVNNSAVNKGAWLGTDDPWSEQGLWGGASSDHTTAANRPKLVVEYTLPTTANSRIALLRFR